MQDSTEKRRIDKVKIHESAENYLETILILQHRIGDVRSIDVANELSFSKPSVSIAMKNLRNAELVTVDASGYLYLTPAGREIAETMYERHTLLSDWLVYLGVDPQKAAEDACRMEHILSAESFQAIKQHVLANKEQTNQNRHA